MDPVIQTFSAGRRLALRPSQAEDLVQRLRARMVSETYTWQESTQVPVAPGPSPSGPTLADVLDAEVRRLVVTAPVGGLVLVESSGQAPFDATTCAELSREAPVYDLGADIWIPFGLGISMKMLADCLEQPCRVYDLGPARE